MKKISKTLFGWLQTMEHVCIFKNDVWFSIFIEECECNQKKKEETKGKSGYERISCFGGAFEKVLASL